MLVYIESSVLCDIIFLCVLYIHGSRHSRIIRGSCGPSISCWYSVVQLNCWSVLLLVGLSFFLSYFFLSFVLALLGTQLFLCCFVVGLVVGRVWVSALLPPRPSVGEPWLPLTWDCLVLVGLRFSHTLLMRVIVLWACFHHTSSLTLTLRPDALLC